MTSIEKVATELVIVADVCNTQISEIAAKRMLEVLSEYPEDTVLHALRRCQRELEGRLYLASIIKRIEELGIWS